jgi:hypothetical protein
MDALAAAAVAALGEMGLVVEAKIGGVTRDVISPSGEDGPYDRVRAGGPVPRYGAYFYRSIRVICHIGVHCLQFIALG